MNIRITSRTLVAAVGSIFLLSTLLWLAIYNSFDPATEQASRTTMLLEASKFLAQLVLVVVLGGMVPVLFNWYAKQQDERKQAREKQQEQQRLRIDEDNALRRKLLASLISIRAQVERTRRGFGLLSETEKKPGYRSTIASLLDTRLQISQIWQDTETWKELYDGHSTEVHDGLSGVKLFLDQMIDEYSSNNARIQAGEESFSQLLRGLPCFESFITGDGGPGYRGDFIETHYRGVARIIRQSILDSSKQIMS